MNFAWDSYEFPLKLADVNQRPLAAKILAILILWSVFGQAANVDPHLLDTLKSDATQDQGRQKQFHQDKKAKNVFSQEREKGLASFLEEQEKWELVREKGIAEQRKQKKQSSPVEGGPEWKEDQKQKELEQKKVEQARKILQQTKQQVASKKDPALVAQELEELDLNHQRPRFDLRKRGRNKWTKGGPAGSTGGKGSSGNGGFAPPPAAFDDYPIQPDYIPAPPPIDGFEEIPPPPPPPVNYDGNSGVNGYPYNGNIDSGFGDAPPPPPPPPPIFEDYE